MKEMTIRQALVSTGGVFYGDECALDNIITAVESDSRKIKGGEIFVAFSGARVDGHSFMAQCLQKGAVCCLSEREPAPEERPCIRVDSTLRAMGALAAWHRSRFDIPVVGITGSVGKTTTKEMVAAVLSQHFNTHKTRMNFNNELGVPQTLLKLEASHEASVVEMGISDFGEMRRLTHMVCPTIALISAIADSHLETLQNRQGVLRAKSEIFESMGAEHLAIFNGDDPMLKGLVPPTRKLTYGMEEQNDFRAEDVEALGIEGIRCTIRHGDAAFKAFVPAHGLHMVYAALAAAAVGNALGMSDEEIARGIQCYQTVGDRAKIIQARDMTVISDCYNANPSSVAAALRSLMLLEGRKVCILGDMLELGTAKEQLHTETGILAAKCGVDLIIACGELSRHTFDGAKQAQAQALWFPNKEALFAQLSGLLKPGDNVLVKASHSMAFEEVTSVLVGKY